jgi:uncharacterized repeat protein (TIGR01451 family)
MASPSSRVIRAAQGLCRTRVLALAGLLAALVVPGIAQADIQVGTTLRLEGVSPGVAVPVFKTDGTQVGGSLIGRFIVRRPSGSETAYTGYCVDVDHTIQEASSYDVTLSWDGRPAGGTDDLPALNGKRDEIAWLLANSQALLDEAGDLRGARAAAIQIVIWQLLGQVRTVEPVSPLELDQGVNAQVDQVSSALESRSRNVAQGLGLSTSAFSASVCGGPASVILTVTGTPNTTASLEIEGQPSPSTASLGGPGVSVDPATGVASVDLGPTGRRQVTLTGATPGPVQVHASASGIRIVHWADANEVANGDQAVQRGVYGLEGSFNQRILIMFQGCGAAAAPPAQPASTFEPKYAPTTRAKLSINHSGPRIARAGKVVRYKVKVRNVGRVTARNLVLRYRIPQGMAVNKRGRAKTQASGPVPSGRTVVVRIPILAVGRTINVVAALRIDSRTSGRKWVIAMVQAGNANSVRKSVVTRVTASSATTRELQASRR